MVGDTVAAGSRLRIHGERVLPGSFYRIVYGLAAGHATTEVPALLEVTATPPPNAKWARVELVRPDLRSERAERCDPVVDPLLPEEDPILGEGTKTSYCRNRLVVEALTSPIYVEP
jgi:hypothetical protein